MNANNTLTENDAAHPSALSPTRTARTTVRDRATELAPPHNVPEPKADAASAAAEAAAMRRSRRRRLLFRCVRLVLSGALMAGAGLYARHAFLSATSEQAFINAEMTVLRAPIEGQLLLEPVQPGALIGGGAKLFRVENPRFGNQEAMAQSNWVRELTERLQAEAEEAAVHLRQQEQVYQLHEKLYEQQLISKLAFLEEETKLTLARTTLTNKEAQARQAESRMREVERQVELQKEAVVQMPFDGVAWTIPARTGAQVAPHEAVLQVIDPRRVWVEAFFDERHAAKMRMGARVTIHALSGPERWRGRVESVRAGVGRIASDNTAGLAVDLTRHNVEVRVAMESNNPYAASDFFGVGRSVVVTLDDFE